MKKTAYLLIGLIAILSQAYAFDSTSINCSGRLGHPDRYSYTVAIEPNSDVLKVTKFVGTRSGGVAVWGYKSIVEYGPIERGIINITDIEQQVYLKIFLEEQTSWGYQGKARLTLNGLDIPMNCTVRF
jgi:hypothetical protein